MAVRYGTLEGHFYPVRSLNRVAKICKLPYSTTRAVLVRYLSNGRNIVNRPRGRPMRFEDRIPAEVATRIYSHAYLNSVKTLSLEQRCHKLQMEDQIRVSPAGLGNSYKRLRICYTSPQIVYRTLLTNSDRIMRERLVFARRLGSLVARG